MNEETARVIEKVSAANRELAEARLATRLAFNAARFPPDEGRVPQWEALPASLRAALEEEDLKVTRLMVAVTKLLPLAVAEGHCDAVRMLTSIPYAQPAPEVHVPRAEETAATPCDDDIEEGRFRRVFFEAMGSGATVPDAIDAVLQEAKRRPTSTHTLIAQLARTRPGRSPDARSEDRAAIARWLAAEVDPLRSAVATAGPRLGQPDEIEGCE